MLTDEEILEGLEEPEETEQIEKPKHIKRKNTLDDYSLPHIKTKLY